MRTGYAIIAGAALLAAALLGLQGYGRAQYTAGYDAAQTEYKLLAAQVEQAAWAREQELQGEIENVRIEYQTLRDAAQTDAARSAAATGRLRDKLAAANRRATSEAARAGSALDENARIAAELRNVVAMCSTRYQQLGEVVDGLRGDLMGLQGWARIAQRVSAH